MKDYRKSVSSDDYRIQISYGDYDQELRDFMDELMEDNHANRKARKTKDKKSGTIKEMQADSTYEDGRTRELWQDLPL